MSTLQELTSLGKELGYSGSELQQFVKDEQDRLREERLQERQERKENEERKLEYERLAIGKENEERKLEYERLAIERLRIESEREVASAQNRSTPQTGVASVVKNLKIPVFNPRTDQCEAWFYRLELVLESKQLDRNSWAGILTNLLTGEALEVLQSLPLTDASNYQAIKISLLHRFRLTKDQYRNRFRSTQPQDDENFHTFVNRLAKMFDKWVELEDIQQGSFDQLRELMIKDQLFQACNPQLVTFLKEHNPKTIAELKQLAEQYTVAHPEKHLGRSDAVAAANAATIGKQAKPYKRLPPQTSQFERGRNFEKHRDLTDFARGPRRSRSETPWRPRFSSEGYNYNSPDRQNQPHAQSMTRGRPHRFTPRGRGNNGYNRHNSSFHGCSRCQNCNSAPIRERRAYYCSHSNANAATYNSNAAAMTSFGVTTGKIVIHQGKVNGTHCTVLRDTGSSICGVVKHFVKDSDYTGRNSECQLFGGKVVSFPTATIQVETPFFTGQVEAHVLERSVADVIIGNIPGARTDTPGESKPHDDDAEPSQDRRKHNFATNVLTRRQAQNDSQASVSHTDAQTPIQFDNTTFRKAQKEDPNLQRLFAQAGYSKSAYVVKNDVLLRIITKNGKTHTQVVIPKSHRLSILKQSHDSITAGHLGYSATKKRILPHFTWPGIMKDIHKYVQSCDVCQKCAPRKPALPLQKMELIGTPFQKVAVDIIGPLHMTPRKNRFILTLVDYATRWPEAIPLKSTTSEDIANALMSIFNRMGIPEEILSDNASNFTSQMMHDVLTVLKASQRTTTAYHPQSNGLCERFNGTLKTMLKKATIDNPSEWDTIIPSLLFAYREVPQTTTGFAPFQLMFGRTPRGPMNVIADILKGNSKEKPQLMHSYEYVKNLKDTILKSCIAARENTEKKSTQYKVYADRTSALRTFNKGDSVLALLPTKGNSLFMSYQGPYTVNAVLDNNNYQIKVGNSLRRYHANILKKYHLRSVPEQSNNVFHTANMALVEEDDDQIRNPCVTIHTPHLQQKENHLNVSIDHKLTTHQREEVSKVLQYYSDVLTDIPGQTDVVKHTIRLKQNEKPKNKHYPIPFHARQAVEKELEEMIKIGIVRESTSPYSSPLTVVKKKDGTIRLCVDFRNLNSVAEFDAEPIPNQEQLMTEITNAKYFSKIDLTKGYWQIPLTEDSKELTAFQSPLGLLEFNYLPFGLASASSTFQRLMKSVLRHVKGAISYFDDILVHSQSWETHLHDLQATFEALRAAGLTARPSKTIIGFQEVNFLGHIVGHGTQRPDPEKIAKMKNIPPPTNKKEVRSLLGILNYYRRFVPNFAEIAQPLTNLTKKGAPNKVLWTSQCEASLRQLKTAFCSKPILALPDLRKPFVVRADASSKALGAVLLQEHNGILRPCQYISRKLIDRETHYPIIEKECLGIVFALTSFAKYLLLRPFLVETDHKPLLFMHKNKSKNSRLLRWALALQQFKFNIAAINGTDNVISDLLSRS